MNGRTMLLRFTTALAAIATMVSVPALGQTQDQQDRLNTLARYVTVSSACRDLGMIIDPNMSYKFAQALEAETAQWQVGPMVVSQLMTEALRRHVRMLKIDLDTASRKMETEQQLRDVGLIFLRYGRTCMEAASDPIFSDLITIPVGFELERAVIEFNDTHLERGGLASWQTPSIRGHGDMMMLAGVCRTQIGRKRSDELVNTYGTSGNSQVRNYYVGAFDEGLIDTDLQFTLAQCNRAISAMRQEVARLQGN